MKKLLMMIGTTAMPRRGFLLYSMRTMIAVVAIAASAMLPTVAKADRHNVQKSATANQVVVGKARFTLLTDRMVRCEWSEDGTFEDRPSLVFVNREMPDVPHKVERMGEGAAISTGRMTLEWRGGPFAEDNLFANGVAVLSEDRENLLGTQRTLDRKTGMEDVLPTMEKGLLSRRGVTVVDDTETPLFVKTESHWKQWVAERIPRAKRVAEGDALVGVGTGNGERGAGSYRDLTVFAYGHDYKGCLGDYVKVAGRIPLPPRYAFGYWWSRYWLYTDTEVREMADTMRSLDIPLDVFIIDMEWHDTWNIGNRRDIRDEVGQYWGWTGYTWNRRLFPDPRATLDYLHSKGCKVALNLHPASGVQPVEECYAAFARDYGWKGTNAIPYHADEEKWADCYFKDVLGPLERDGVDFWWLDWQQWKMSKDKPSLNNTFWLNHIFAQHATGRPDKRPLIHHRWGGLGSHRYQVGMSGDAKISWTMLSAIPWFTATASNVGYGYWGHCIGGHMNPDGDDGTNGEMYTRALQSSVFLPIIWTHGTKDTRIERRIWKYQDHFLMMREALNLRYRLAPYIYTAARAAYDTGVSLCRPLYYDWPEDENAYAVTNAYMFGNDILAAAITSPMDRAKGVSEIDIYFPEGHWYDVSTGDLIEGGRTMRRAYAMADNPWFIRAGAVIPMYPDSVRNLANPGTDDLVLLFAPGAERGESEIYEDGGDNADYATNFTKTRLVREGNRVTIAPRKGAYTLKFPLLAAPLAVNVNGKDCGWEYDAADLAVVVRTPPQDGTRETVVELALPANAAAVSSKLCGLKGEFSRTDVLSDEFKNAINNSLPDSHWLPARVNLPDSWQRYWQTRAAIVAEPSKLDKHLADRDAALKAFSMDFEKFRKRLPEQFAAKMRNWINAHLKR